MVTNLLQSGADTFLSRPLRHDSSSPPSCIPWISLILVRRSRRSFFMRFNRPSMSRMNLSHCTSLLISCCKSSLDLGWFGMFLKYSLGLGGGGGDTRLALCFCVLGQWEFGGSKKKRKRRKKKEILFLISCCKLHLICISLKY